MSLLNDLPLATLQTLVGIGLAVLAYINNDLTIFQAFVAVGANTAGAGAIGHARTGAGRGLRH